VTTTRIIQLFALLLAIATTVSFVGYRYLLLSSEYRNRNFVHLSEVHALAELLEVSPVLSGHDAAVAREHARMAKAQATWCLDNLTAVETRVFRWLGASEGLAICRQAIDNAEAALSIIDEMADPDGARRTDPASLYFMGRKVEEQAALMLEDSRAFQPYVSVMERRIQRFVSVGTAFTSVALAFVFAVLAVRLAKSIRRQAAQTEELAKLAAAVENANDAMVISDTQGLALWANATFERLTGYPAEEVLGKRPADLLQGPDTDPTVRKKISDALQQVKPIKCEILNYREADVAYWIELSISPLYDEAGKHCGFVAISSEITDRVEQRTALEEARKATEYQALHDPLTGLPNRRYLDDVMQARTEGGEEATLIRIDLDHFKYVNDTLGHAAGDLVLRNVADILRTELRSGDFPARVGGDEFVILLSPDVDLEEATPITERLLEKIRVPMEFDGKSMQIGASFGIADSRDALLSLDELAIGADAALYEAKEQGRNTIELYTPALHAKILSRRDLTRELKKAVANEEFVPYFQPQFDAQSRRIVGVETLVRWPSTQLGLLQPHQFLPIAEKLSIVEEIDDIVFRKAIMEISVLHEAGLGIEKLAFNVTAPRILDPNIVKTVSEARPKGLNIAFEVLESVLVEEQSDHFNLGVDTLREAGISIEVDDFGSGHASVIALMQLKPDAMKIDRRLTLGVVEHSVYREIVRNVVGIADSLELTVIAEGVESEDQASCLMELGCDVLQGFAFARPMPAGELHAYLTDVRPVVALGRRELEGG
jgi:diguanylate cyclase (GGDEF)-like protein/PAS domain S-box-containing protein